MSNNQVLDITPHVSLFHKLGRVRFTINSALPEFIDNCIDGWHAKLPSLVVQIRLNREDRTLEIMDNSDGFDIRELGFALTIGYSSEGDSRIGENGFGLKAASTFLGNTLEIITRKHGANTVYRVRYNRDEFVQAGDWELPYETLGPEVMPQPGTKIMISELNVDLGSVKDDSVVEHLSRVYRTYLESGKLALLVNKTEVKPSSLSRLDKPYWKISFEIPGAGMVTGWVGARDPKSAPKADVAGFELFRRGRLIRTREWVGYRWTSRLRHMIGELNLDGFDVNNNKTDFIRDTPEWSELERQLKDTLQSYRVNKYVYEATLQKRASSGGATHGSAAPSGSTGGAASGGAASGGAASGGAASGGAASGDAASGGAASSGAASSGAASGDAASGGAASSGAASGGAASGGAASGGAASSGAASGGAASGSLSKDQRRTQRWHLPKKDKLALTDLHPEIRVGCEILFVQGHIFEAVREAFDIVNRYTRKKIGMTDDNGADMMRQVFNPDSAKAGRVPAQLRLSDLNSKSGRDLQEGFMHIFAGAQQGIRNPMAHGRIKYKIDEALEHLAFASLLCRQIDKASVHTT